MRALPESKLDPKIKSVWRINDAIWIIISFLICFGIAAVIAVIAAEEGDAPWAPILLAAVAILFAALAVLCLIILPPIRYARWRYQLTDDFLDIAKGIIWKQRIVIPFIRVQNTDTRQGPIMRAFGLASVTVSTAAGEHEIPGLALAEAADVRDKAAELARIPREDV